jgi:hypothetical protein
MMGQFGPKHVVAGVLLYWDFQTVLTVIVKVESGVKILYLIDWIDLFKLVI